MIIQIYVVDIVFNAVFLYGKQQAVCVLCKIFALSWTCCMDPEFCVANQGKTT